VGREENKPSEMQTTTHDRNTKVVPYRRKTLDITELLKRAITDTRAVSRARTLRERRDVAKKRKYCFKSASRGGKSKTHKSSGAAPPAVLRQGF